jgi:hypothetical protein
MAKDFYATRSTAWWKVAIAMIGSCLSGVTFVSVPGMVGAVGFGYLQMCVGFFLGYLVVSSIQMGANIDYAIVIAGRYTELREKMGKRDAIIDTMNLSFPTIITSGTMMAVAGILIGKMTSDAVIYGIGKCLGRGTIISIIVTMFVLPQILLVGDKVIELTAFVMNMPIQNRQISGAMRIDGVVRGRIDGTVNGVVHAVVKGNVSAFIDNGNVKMIEDDETNDVTGTVEQEGV